MRTAVRIAEGGCEGAFRIPMAQRGPEAAEGQFSEQNGGPLLRRRPFALRLGAFLTRRTRAF